jgi:hypothetical protein
MPVKEGGLDPLAINGCSSFLNCIKKLLVRRCEVEGRRFCVSLPIHGHIGAKRSSVGDPVGFASHPTAQNGEKKCAKRFWRGLEIEYGLCATFFGLIVFKTPRPRASLTLGIVHYPYKHFVRLDISKVGRVRAIVRKSKTHTSVGSCKDTQESYSGQKIAWVGSHDAVKGHLHGCASSASLAL